VFVCCLFLRDGVQGCSADLLNLATTATATATVMANVELSVANGPGKLQD
jgi:hypothetical protein